MTFPFIVTQVLNLLIFKIGTLCSALFLLFATSTLVSFILSQTQQRMLRFTLQLHQYVRARLAVAPMILVHLLESLVFVPILLGVLFFMFEFFGDQFLAFTVLMTVWACELYSAVCCRTLESIRAYPRVYLLCFTLFHCYHLCCPFGFQFLALIATMGLLFGFSTHLLFHFELPGLMGRT